MLDSNDNGPLLTLSNPAVTYAGVEGIDLQQYFKPRAGLQVYADFIRRVLARTTQKSVQGTTGNAYDFERSFVSDREIEAELKSGYIFEDLSELCHYLAHKMENQKGGGDGNLLVNAEWNRFYTPKCVVKVRWWGRRSRWEVDALSRDFAPGFGKGRVFARN